MGLLPAVRISYLHTIVQLLSGEEIVLYLQYASQGLRMEKKNFRVSEEGFLGSPTFSTNTSCLLPWKPPTGDTSSTAVLCWLTTPNWPLLSRSSTRREYVKTIQMSRARSNYYWTSAKVVETIVIVKTKRAKCYRYYHRVFVPDHVNEDFQISLLHPPTPAIPYLSFY